MRLFNEILPIEEYIQDFDNKVEKVFLAAGINGNQVQEVQITSIDEDRVRVVLSLQRSIK
jgi:hypothetical protein